jgi:hypothetical protein
MIIRKWSASVSCGAYAIPILLCFAVCCLARSASAQTQPDLAGGQFAQNCGQATAAPIFDASKMNTGLYGVNNVIAVSDPDIVLIGNQWWMIFATGPGDIRAIEPFAAYLPQGASLSTATTYPSDPNGWHLVGAQADGNGIATPISPTPSSWDFVAAETPSADVGSDGTVSIYYSGHNSGQTAFQIGIMTDFNNGKATGDPNPVMSAQEPWEFSSNLGALLEQSVRWQPQLNQYLMYYTAGAWWASPPDNTLAYAESVDGINWENRQKLDFDPSYYNQDFVYNAPRNRYEMVISKDPTGAGGANPRNLVWVEAATPAVAKADWVHETTLLEYNAANNAPWYNSGLLSPAMKYGNLPGEENRLYVFFHSYTQQGDMFIGRFYCDANLTAPTLSFSAIPQHTYGDAPFTVSASSASNGAVTYSVISGPAAIGGGSGLVTLMGAGTLDLGASQVASGSFAAATASQSLSILPQATLTGVTASAASVSPVQAVTLTATVTPAVAGSVTPTQTVSFFDAGTTPATQVGNATPLASGQAILSGITFTSGQHSIYADYSGDVNYLPSTSQNSAVGISVAALDFSIGVTGADSLTIAQGSSASFNFAVAPTYAVYPGPVSFAVAGLPPGASCTVSPSNLSASAGSQTVKITIQTAAASSVPGGERILALALLLPVLLLRRLRVRFLPGMAAFLLLAASFLASTGCGASSKSLSNPTSYNVTVTATSGTVAHNATVILQVQ